MFGSGAPGDRPNVPNVAIILTDGKPTGVATGGATGEALAKQEAQMLRDSGVRIISIGVTRQISESLLKDMSSPPRVKDQDYFTSPDFNKLKSLLLNIINSACPATAVTTTTATTTPSPEIPGMYWIDSAEQEFVFSCEILAWVRIRACESV